MLLAPISDELRDAIESNGFNPYQLQQKTGVTHTSINRFLTGGRGLHFEAIDALADFLQLELSRKGKRAKRDE